MFAVFDEGRSPGVPSNNTPGHGKFTLLSMGIVLPKLTKRLVFVFVIVVKFAYCNCRVAPTVFEGEIQPTSSSGPTEEDAVVNRNTPR